MSGDWIRELSHAEPFVPFAVHTSSGDVYRIKHPEQVLVTGARVSLWHPESDLDSDQVVTCSVLHITGVEYAEKRPKKKGGKS